MILTRSYQEMKDLGPDMVSTYPYPYYLGRGEDRLAGRSSCRAPEFIRDR